MCSLSYLSAKPLKERMTLSLPNLTVTIVSDRHIVTSEPSIIRCTKAANADSLFGLCACLLFEHV